MPAPGPVTPSITPAVPAGDPSRRPHDGSRTRVEARIAFASVEEEEEIPTPTRRLTVRGITSGLADDSREEDERAGWLRDPRGRVKAARAVVANTPGLAEVLQRNRQKAARSYARFGVTEAVFREEVPFLIDGEGPS